MKVKNLLEALQGVDLNADVILQRDNEGNSYQSLVGLDAAAVFEPRAGAVYSLNWSAAEACMSEKEWRKMKNRKRCVVLYPSN